MSGYICIQFMLLAVIKSSVFLLVNIIVMSSNTSITSNFMLTLSTGRSSIRLENAY